MNENLPNGSITWDAGKERVKSIVPPLSYSSHKGQMGRVGVLGGSKDFTGAPFYAASSALKFGADLVYVFTAEEAALPLKCYSPELMVTPVYSHRDRTPPQEMATAVIEYLPRLHSLVIGPGLGRDPLVLEATASIIEQATTLQLPVVIDADGLFLVAQRPDIVENKEKVVLTPNIMEFKRIWEAVYGKEVPVGEASELAQRLGVTVLLKGRYDVIASPCGNQLVCVEQGGMKRGGGIGDILSGGLGTMVAWAARVENQDHSGAEALDLPFSWAAWGTCNVVKRSALEAFLKMKRSMTAPDVLNEVGMVFENMIPALEKEDSETIDLLQRKEHICSEKK